MKDIVKYLTESKTVESFSKATVAAIEQNLLGMKVKIGNTFLKFMGTITLEFYLIHGLAIELFGYDFDGDAKPLYYIKSNVLLTVISLVSGIILAVLLHKLYMVLAGRKKSGDKPSGGPETAASAG